MRNLIFHKPDAIVNTANKCLKTLLVGLVSIFVKLNLAYGFKLRDIYNSFYFFSVEGIETKTCFEINSDQKRRTICFIVIEIVKGQSHATKIYRSYMSP